MINAPLTISKAYEWYNTCPFCGSKTIDIRRNTSGMSNAKGILEYECLMSLKVFKIINGDRRKCSVWHPVWRAVPIGQRQPKILLFEYMILEMCCNTPYEQGLSEWGDLGI